MVGMIGLVMPANDQASYSAFAKCCSDAQLQGRERLNLGMTFRLLLVVARIARLSQCDCGYSARGASFEL